MRVKVIRGKPIYVYKKCKYFDQPPKTTIKKLVYNQDENITYVYCKKPKYWVEFICSIIILLCIYLNLMWIHKANIKVRYNSVSTYYNDCLYINLTSDETNIYDVKYTLSNNDKVVATGVLQPGELIVKIPIEEVDNTYDLLLEYNTLFSTESEKVKINVIDRSK